MKIKQQVLNAAIYMGFSIAASVLGFVAVLVLTRNLLPEEYGRIGLFFSILYFVAPVVSLSADGLVAVNKTVLEPRQYKEFQQTYITLGYICFLAVQVTFIVGYEIGLYDDWMIVMVPIFALSRLLTGMASSEYITEQKSILFGVLTLGSSALALLLTALFIEAFGNSGAFRVLAMFLSELIMLVIRFWGRMPILLKPQLHVHFVKRVLQFGLPGIISIAGAWALNESDKVIISSLTGMTSVGIYSAAAALAAIMMTFNQALSNALYPGMFLALSDSSRSINKVLYSYVATFTLLAAIFCLGVIGCYFLFSDLILPTRYLGVQNIFTALMLSGLAVSFYRPIALAADFFLLTRTRAVAVSVGGLVTILVTYLGIPFGGAIWAPIGIASGYMSAAFIISLVLRLIKVRQ